MQLLRVGIEQQLVRIEAVPLLGRVGPVDAKAVELAGPEASDVAVIDLVGVFGQLDPHRLADAVAVEEADLDGLGILREDCEIDAIAVEGGSLGVGQTRLHLEDAWSGT